MVATRSLDGEKQMTVADLRDRPLVPQSVSAEEPQPAESRRLPRAASRPAPVFALLWARWTWLAVGMVLGIVAGLLLGSSSTYQAKRSLHLTSVGDGVRAKQIGQTYERLVMSPVVLTKAAQTAGTTPEELAKHTTALWQLDTDIVDITVINSDGKKAIAHVNAVGDALTAYIQQSSLDQLKGINADISQQLKNPLPAARPEQARQDQLGAQAAQAQADAIASANAVTVGEPATTAATSGASRLVTALMGGLGGLFLSSVAALAAGTRRRRVRSAEELRALAPELQLRATTQAGEVAGRLLESGRSVLVVLSLPSTPSSASRFAAAVANHLRTHGTSVTLVNAITVASSDSSTMALPDEVWVLRRDIRRDIQSYFGTDLLVVACSAEPEAVGLISGQSDLMTVVMAKESRTTVQQIWDAAGAVAASDPLVVVAP